MSKMAELSAECDRLCESCNAENMKMCDECCMKIKMHGVVVSVEGLTRRIISVKKEETDGKE